MPKPTPIAPDNQPPPIAIDAELRAMKLGDGAIVTLELVSAPDITRLAQLFARGQLAVHVTITPVQHAMTLDD